MFTDHAGKFESVQLRHANIDQDNRDFVLEQVLERVASTAMPRSSIIISDEALSAETNYRTEFVAVLSNQPQGGFITRAPTPVVRYARSDDGFFSFFQPNWGYQQQQQQTVNPRQQRGGQRYYYPQQQQQGWGW